MSYIECQIEGIEMWAVLHIPSGAWFGGHREHTFYPTEYEARYHCPNDAFQPVKVVVRNAAKHARTREGE